MHLPSSDFTSSHLLFICFSTLHIVGSLLFKLPSMRDLWGVLDDDEMIVKDERGKFSFDEKNDDKK